MNDTYQHEFGKRTALHTKQGFDFYAGITLAAVRDLNIEEQMAEISARVYIGELAGVPPLQLNVLRRFWRLLYEQLYGLSTVH